MDFISIFVTLHFLYSAFRDVIKINSMTTAQIMKFSIKDFSSKCEQICSFFLTGSIVSVCL